MKKLIVFDLDGVLVDSKDLHYQALNLALQKENPEWVIGYEDHVKIYNGNPTKVKLEILSKKYPEITESVKLRISDSKQSFTSLLLEDVKKDDGLIEIFTNLIKYNCKIAVASNSVRDTVETVLKKLGVYEYVGLVLSNEDVTNPKPSPEIYIKCMKHFNLKPEQTVIFEDSYIGCKAATDSGAQLIQVQNRLDIDKKIMEGFEDE